MQSKLKSPQNNTQSSDYLQADKDELLDVIEQKSQLLTLKDKRIKVLEESLRLARLKRFGRSSEQSDDQAYLFDEVEQILDEQPEAEEILSESTAPIPTKKKQKTGRKPFSADLPRKAIYLKLTEEEKEGAIDTFFTKVKEELDIIPAQVQVIEYFQEKAIFAETTHGDSRQIKAALLPKHPFPKAMGSIRLMAHIIIAKYADGLPLYRMESILERYGGDISRATMANWVIKLSQQLQPLINLLWEQQLSGSIIQMDETRIQVLKEPGRSITSDKYMWVSRSGMPEHPSVLFEYDPSRSQEIPLRLLDGFSGYLQTDGYAGYNAACHQNEITQLGCWDHARRKFKEAQKAQPKGKKNQKPTKADMALAYINKLYLIERQLKDSNVNEKYQARQKQSLLLLKQLRKWIDNNLGKVPKDSLTGVALTYVDNQWEKLMVYCDDGRLNISNILAENAIRPFVIGRKAWLFADTPKGAKASSVHYSLIETARANSMEPYAYLVSILERLPYADTVEKLEELLPWNLKKSNLENVNNAVH